MHCILTSCSVDKTINIWLVIGPSNCRNIVFEFYLPCKWLWRVLSFIISVSTRCFCREKKAIVCVI